MNVIANGFPKHGNHALVKGLQLLGVPCQVNHIPCAEGVAGRHVFIKRDPRNALCSWLRFVGRPVTPGMFITAFRDFDGRPLVAAMAEYEGWLADAGTLVIRYEDLIADSAVLRDISRTLETPYIDGAFEALPGLTRTWNADHSDYRAIWTADVEAVWAAEGGPDLLARWGY